MKPVNSRVSPGLEPAATVQEGSTFQLQHEGLTVAWSAKQQTKRGWQHALVVPLVNSVAMVYQTASRASREHMQKEVRQSANRVRPGFTSLRMSKLSARSAKPADGEIKIWMPM